MIVRTIEDISETSRDVRGPGWRSRRLVLRDDGMGYSLHDTIVKEGSALRLQYKHHLETNYCIAGEGEVTNVATGTTFAIRPGTLYALDKHDEHILRALHGDLRLVCVFSPALSGLETHSSDGSYAIEPPDNAAVE
jgi:L-ectoine synthase